MTQIINVLTRKRLFHLSDRLLTQQGIGTVSPFDEQANKAIVFVGSNYHSLISYTGRAYFRGVPTDAFLAQCLMNADQPLGGYMSAHCVGKTDLYSSVQRMKAGLSSEFSKLTIPELQPEFTVSICGWIQKDLAKPIQPFAWELKKQPNSSEFSINHGFRWWGWEKYFLIAAIPNPKDRDTLKKLAISLNEINDPLPIDIMHRMIWAMDHCHETDPDYIGSSYMLVDMNPLGPLFASIQYISNEPSPSKESTNQAYTPWILIPPAAYSPAVITGKTPTQKIYDSSGYSWEVFGISNSAKGEALKISSMKRKEFND